MQPTGYLQDAVAQWIHLLIDPPPPTPPPPSSQELDHLLQGDSGSRCSSLEERRQSKEQAAEHPFITDSRRRRDASKKSSSRRVALVMMCPFAVVKPDGVTLEDINARLLKRPPVGEPAAAAGVHKRRQGMPGLSGKAVVAATRIRTGARGTVTIIRTKE